MCLEELVMFGRIVKKSRYCINIPSSIYELLRLNGVNVEKIKNIKIMELNVSVKYYRAGRKAHYLIIPAHVVKTLNLKEGETIIYKISLVREFTPEWG